MGNIEYNRELAARVSEFQTMAAKRNSAIGYSLEDSVVKLIGCTYSLNKATREELLELTRNKRIVDYILRIIKEEPLDKILKNVPLTKSGKHRIASSPIESKEWDGRQDNVERALEDGLYA